MFDLVRRLRQRQSPRTSKPNDKCASCYEVARELEDIFVRLPNVAFADLKRALRIGERANRRGFLFLATVVSLALHRHWTGQWIRMRHSSEHKT